MIVVGVVGGYGLLCFVLGLSRVVVVEFHRASSRQRGRDTESGVSQRVSGAGYLGDCG
jgi:hypothetical protein